MEEQPRQHILDLPKVIAGAIASPVAALLASRFGVAGTLLGLALSTVVIIVITDVLKASLARAGTKVAEVPVILHHAPKGAYKKKGSPLLGARRHSILIRSALTAVIVFLLGLGVVTSLEIGVGESLSCWVWKDCPTQSSTKGESSANSESGSQSTGNSVSPNTETLPSILGGSPSPHNSGWPGGHSNPQPLPEPLPTPTPSAPGTPSPSLNVSPDSPAPSNPLPPPDQLLSPSDGGYIPENQQQGEPGQLNDSSGAQEQRPLETNGSEITSPSPPSAQQGSQPKQSSPPVEENTTPLFWFTT